MTLELMVQLLGVNCQLVSSVTQTQGQIQCRNQRKCTNIETLLLNLHKCHGKISFSHQIFLVYLDYVFSSLVNMFCDHITAVVTFSGE